ncbi:hypothetical protein F4780DRAFT_614983 [Xylariomycetidae sp. FL0641]|nr:hypothetical protein F4780DRAFT_614983 [Xylariomycetidae sp. FL0641]
MSKGASRTRPTAERAGGRHAGPKTFETHVPDTPLLVRHGNVSDPALYTLRSYNDKVGSTKVGARHLPSHLNRPFPATPPPEASMSERPNTSGGPSSKRPAAADFRLDKRMSRDDSFLNLGAGRERGFGTYTTIQGQLPAPDASLRPSRSLRRRPSAPRSRMAPMAELPKDETPAAIGMALGSPPLPPQSRGASPAPGLSSKTNASDAGKGRKQPGKRRLFGMFGRKHSTDPISTAATSSEPNVSMPAARPERSEFSMPERSNTVSSRHQPKHKPIVIRSQTVPHVDEASQYAGKQSKEGFGSIPIALDAAAPKPSGGLLNVDIPDVTMERYSVMFDSVLHRQSSSQSLLARRQATMQKLKCIEDAIEHEQENNRAQSHARKHSHARTASHARTTSHARTASQKHTKSPSLALFPSTPAKRPPHVAPPMLSPRMRSNTSPAHLPSPTKGAFDEASPRNTSVHGATGQRSDKPKPKPILSSVTQERDQSRPTQPFYFSNNSSTLILESPTDLEDEEPEFEIIRTGTFQSSLPRRQPSPKWQMMSPSSASAESSSSVASDRRRSPSSTSSAHTHVTQPSQDYDDPHFVADTSKMNPVEISIARQISVSHQQRKMLRPLRTGSPAGSKTSARSSPSKASPFLGLNERLVDTKSSTPTLVTPTEDWDAQLARNRKSERIVLDGL